MMPGRSGNWADNCVELAADPESILGFGRSLLLSPAGSLVGEVQAGLPAYCRQYFRNFRGQVVLPLLLRPCFIHPVTVMVRRSALEKIGGFLQLHGLGLVDHPTFLELAGQGIFFGSAEVLGFYRRHRDSQSLNHIVELTAGERQLVFEFMDQAAVPASRELKRRLEQNLGGGDRLGPLDPGTTAPAARPAACGTRLFPPLPAG